MCIRDRIQDDILDVTKSSKELGKSASDLDNKKSTYVTLLGLGPVSYTHLKSWLVVGKDAIAYGDCMEGQFQDFQIRKKALSASEIEDEFDRFYPEVLLSEITIPNAEDLRENPTLYPEVDSQYEAQWTSSNPCLLYTSRCV